MKKILIFLMSICLFLCCGCKRDIIDGGGPPVYNYPEFTTEYTEEEHKQRILERMIETHSLMAEHIVGYEVEIIYSFYDYNPEYYLITVEHTSPTSVGVYYPNGEQESVQYKTYYEHFVGRIVEDTYIHSGKEYVEFRSGRSPWGFLGYIEAKKYYGNDIFAVETENGILQIFDGRLRESEHCLEFMDYYVMRGATQQKLLTASEQKLIKADTSFVGTIYELYRRESEKFKAVKQ